MRAALAGQRNVELYAKYEAELSTAPALRRTLSDLTEGDGEDSDRPGASP